MRPARVALLLAALAATPASARAEGGFADDPPRVTSPEGRRYRVAFDPASRITLGIAGAAIRGRSGAIAAAPEIAAGLAYRSVSASGAGRERVGWQIEHRVASGFVQPFAGPRAGLPALDAAAYGVALLRHDESPSLVLPASPPVGLPFPFDVGIDAEAGRVSVGSTAAAPVIHVGVLRAALLLDPWRSRAPGRIFALGIGARYDLDVEAPGGRRATRIRHRVAPMTAGSVRLRAESEGGLWVADARVEVAPCWSSEGSWAPLARAAAHLERTLIAVADQPITAFVEGAYRFDPATSGAPATHDARGSVGIALHLPLR